MTAFGLTLNVPRLTLAPLRAAIGRFQRRANVHHDSSAMELMGST
jgi:hypothetical protein